MKLACFRGVLKKRLRFSYTILHSTKIRRQFFPILRNMRNNKSLGIRSINSTWKKCSPCNGCYSLIRESPGTRALSMKILLESVRRPSNYSSCALKDPAFRRASAALGQRSTQAVTLVITALKKLLAPDWPGNAAIINSIKRKRSKARGLMHL